MADKKDVNSPSQRYLQMEPIWKMVKALNGGTPAMRNAGQMYLPQHDKESDDAYRARLCRSVLFNYFRKSLTTLAAKPFTVPVKLGEEVPEELKPLADDVDKLGNDLTCFSRAVFRDGLSKGFTHILVDFPTVDSEKVRTLADEQASGARPYFVHIPAEAVIAAYSEVVDGVEKLTHVRILESEIQRDGYDEIVVTRVRVLEPGTYEVWEQKGQNTSFTKVASGTTKLDYIPLVTFYAQREGFMLSLPPLMDLAYKNVEHWQASSDQRNVLTVARFPILAGTGIAKDADVTIGPRKLLAADDPAAKFYYVEHTGSAIAAGKADLDDLKDEMAMLGIELLVRKGGAATATEKSLNAESTNSELQAMAEAYSDALEHCFSIAAEWMGTKVDDDKLSVEVHTDFGISEGDAKDIDVLFKARTTREISHEAFIHELKRRGVLVADFDVEDDQAKLDSEPPPALPALAPGKSPAGPGKPPPGSEKPVPGGKAPAPGNKAPPQKE